MKKNNVNLTEKCKNKPSRVGFSIIYLFILSLMLINLINQFVGILIIINLILIFLISIVILSSVFSIYSLDNNIVFEHLFFKHKIFLSNIEDIHIYDLGFLYFILFKVNGNVIFKYKLLPSTISIADKKERLNIVVCLQKQLGNLGVASRK